MTYYTGDIPVDDVVIEPSESPRPINLAGFTEAEAELRDPDGVLVDLSFPAAIEDDQIIVEWPTSTPFESAGVYTLNVTLWSLDGPQRQRLAPVYIVAQTDDGWHTVDSARTVWSDATDDDARLHQLLTLARQQVLAFAPSLLLGAPIPPNYREAQLMQSRNIWNAGKVDPATGGFGEDSFVIRPFPLDWHVKQLLRPAVALPKAIG